MEVPVCAGERRWRDQAVQSWQLDAAGLQLRDRRRIVHLEEQRVGRNQPLLLTIGASSCQKASEWHLRWGWPPTPNCQPEASQRPPRRKLVAGLLSPAL
jgi:hypothetical protein